MTEEIATAEVEDLAAGDSVAAEIAISRAERSATSVWTGSEWSITRTSAGFDDTSLTGGRSNLVARPEPARSTSAVFPGPSSEPGTWRCFRSVSNTVSPGGTGQVCRRVSHRNVKPYIDSSDRARLRRLRVAVRSRAIVTCSLRESRTISHGPTHSRGDPAHHNR